MVMERNGLLNPQSAIRNRQSSRLPMAARLVLNAAHESIFFSLFACPLRDYAVMGDTFHGRSACSFTACEPSSTRCGRHAQEGQKFRDQKRRAGGHLQSIPGQLQTMLDANGLKPISGHFPFERYRDDIDGVVRDAKALGLQYAGCAWIPHNGDFDEKTCRDAAAVFNKAGEALGKEDIKFFYHTHGYEFQPYKDGTLFDLLMEETKPDLVKYEMDVFWIVHPKQDPAKLLHKYPKRWASCTSKT